MKAYKSILSIFLSIFLSCSCFGMISVGNLSKEEASKLSITMKHRLNGDAVVKVWLEFEEEGFLEKFTYCELQMVDAKGKRILSAMLHPNPVTHGQSKDLTTVAFSADPAQLTNCSFMVVSYGSSRGDVGYVLAMKDFVDSAELEKYTVAKRE